MGHVIPPVCLVLPMIHGAAAMRRGLGRALLVPAGALAAVMVRAIPTGRQAGGWDTVGHGVVAVLMAAPALIGPGAGAADRLVSAHRAGASGPAAEMSARGCGALPGLAAARPGG